uniref:Uncharacterized protein n=1 Tax=Alexandrium monilatum TaxID=311494 RepID=A0A7S4QBE2_9DINO
MLAVLTAKWTGDAVTSGRSVYAVRTELNGLTEVRKKGPPHRVCSQQCESEGYPGGLVHKPVSAGGKPFIASSASLQPAGLPIVSSKDASAGSPARSQPADITRCAAPVGV